MAGANLSDHLAVLSAAAGLLFRESEYGRRLAAWGGAADAGQAAKRAGLSAEQVGEWLAGRLLLPPYQESVLVCAFLDEAERGRNAPPAMSGGGGEPRKVPMRASFTFDAPAMPPDEWEMFAKHLASSSVRWGNDARRSGGHGSAVVTATLAALAAAVARAAPGERGVRVAIPELSAPDQHLVRQILVRSRDRAASEDAAGDRPGHNDAARRGLDALHEQWAGWMNYRDPRTGWRPRKQRAEV